MTISDARKRTEQCPGVDHCDRINAVLDHDFATTAQVADAIRETCRVCEKVEK